jgi:putative FmdB family regulatory protein
MPLVDVECPKCRRTSEVLTRNGEAIACPECGSLEVERKLGVPSIGRGGSLPLTRSSCPPPSAPPCGPGCCRLPQ